MPECHFLCIALLEPAQLVDDMVSAKVTKVKVVASVDKRYGIFTDTLNRPKSNKQYMNLKRS